MGNYSVPGWLTNQNITLRKMQKNEHLERTKHVNGFFIRSSYTYKGSRHYDIISFSNK